MKSVDMSVRSLTITELYNRKKSIATPDCFGP